MSASAKPKVTRLASIQFKTWLKQASEQVGGDIRASAQHVGLKTSGLIRLPTRINRYNVLRSPFVNKKAFDQFEKREYNRLIEIFGEGTQSADATKTVYFLRYLEHTILPAHGGAARAKVTLYSDECIEPQNTRSTSNFESDVSSVDASRAADAPAAESRIDAKGAPPNPPISDVEVAYEAMTAANIVTERDNQGAAAEDQLSDDGMANAEVAGAASTRSMEAATVLAEASEASDAADASGDSKDALGATRKS